jgi:hypothetical protein
MSHKSVKSDGRTHSTANQAAESAPGTMKTIRRFLFIAFACCTTYPCASLAAEEIKYLSPDGRFALRIIDEQKVELIEKASGRVMVDLGEAWHSPGQVSQILVWSRDSKWAAYANRGDKEGEVKVYFWNSSTFEEVTLPEDLPSPDIKFRQKIGSLKNYGGAVTPLRWLKSGELELLSDSMMLDRDSGATYTGKVRFTLVFDPQHHASVKNVGKTKTEVSDQMKNVSVSLNTNKAMSELNSFTSIRACPPWRNIRGQTCVAGVLILLSFSSAFAESDFSAFWNAFKSAVIAGDKAKVAEMTKFPVSMPYGVKAVKNKEDFLRRYNEIFKGEANAAQCFGSAKPRKESAGRYEIYCLFKETPNDRENAPIRFEFELTKGGWKFAGLDNINE